MRIRRLFVIGLVALIATSTAGHVAPTGNRFLSARLVSATGGGAAPGRTLHFSGVLTDPGTGTPLSGSFTMQFGMFDAEAGGVQKWTETQPGTQVKKGVFNVQLGSVTDFPADLFDTSPLYIEITINPPSTPLAPRVLIARTGNAFHADKADDVKNAAITKDKLRDKAVEREKIQDKAVNEEKINDKAVKREKIEDKAVNEEKINDKAVKREKIEDKAVDRSKLETKAVGKDELDTDAVEKEKLKDGAVGKSKIENGAVDKDKLEDGAVTEQKLAGGVLEGLRGQPGARAQFSIATLAPPLSYLSGFDVAVGVDGLPIVAAVYGDGLRQQLHAIHCEDPACTRRTDTIVDNNAGDHRPRVVVGADGLPFLFYAQFPPPTPMGSSVVRCRNIACTQTSSPTTLPHYGLGVAQLSRAGLPVVATDGGVYTCEDQTCASWNVVVGLSELPPLGMAVDGVALVAIEGPDGLVVVPCEGGGCTFSGSPPIVAPQDAQAVTMAIGSDGNPVIAFLAGTGSGSKVQLVHCKAMHCEAADAPVTVPLEGARNISGASVGADGRPAFVVVHHPPLGGRVSLTLVRCATDTCERTTSTPVVPDWPGPEFDPFPGGIDPSITTGADGYPVIVLETDQGISFIHCANRYCVPFYRER